MCRFVLAALLTCILGCGSSGEPSPSASSGDDAPGRSAERVASAQVDKLMAQGNRLFAKRDYAPAIEAFTEAIQLDDQNALAYRDRARASMSAAGFDEVLRASAHNHDSEEVVVRSPSEPEHARLDPSSKATYEDALADLHRAIERDGSDIEAYTLKGQCLTKLGKYVGALAAFDEVIRRAPEEADGYHKRAVVHSYLKDWAQAETGFTQAIELDPKMTKALVARAYSKLFVDDRVGALADFDEAIRIDDTDPHSYMGRGNVYLKSREYEKAVTNFTKVIMLDPDLVAVYANRGAAYIRLGRESEAIADCSRAIAFYSKDPIAYGNRALAYMKTGLFHKALADVDVAVELSPNNTALIGFRGQILAKMQRPDEARASLRKVEWLKQLMPSDRKVARRPDDADVYRRRADHYAQGEQWDRAVSDFNKAIQIDPQSYEAPLGRAKVRLKQGEFRKAVADCNKALRHSSAKEIYSVRGDAHFELDDYDSAISDYNRAMLFGPTIARAYRLRSQARRAAGDSEAAREDLQRAIALDPDGEQPR